MGSGIDPKVDYVFKVLCGSEDLAPLLVDLLNAVLRFTGPAMVRGVHILNPFVGKEYAEGKVSILDVKARDDLDRQFRLEMQQLLPGAFAKRLLYYWSCGHSEQMSKGQRYELLQPTYSICFLNQAMFDDTAYRHTFHVHDVEHGIRLCRDLEMHILELSKFDVPVEEVKTPLERWCYFFKHGASLEPNSLPATLDVPRIRQAVEVLMRISQDEIDRERYRERQRALRDAAAREESAQVAQQEAYDRGLEQGIEKGLEQGIEKGLEQGIEKGLEQGIERGIEKGELVGSIRLLQQILAQAQTPREELLRLSVDELRRMAERLEQQRKSGGQTNGTPPDQP